MSNVAILSLVALAIHTPHPAPACSAADELSALHTIYSTLLAGQPVPSAGTPSLDIVDIVRRITKEGAPADVSTLARISADVSHLVELSRNGPAALELSPRVMSRHLDNLKEVRDWIRATSCDVDLPVSAGSPETRRDRDKPLSSQMPYSGQSIRTSRPYLFGLAVVLALAGLIGGGAVLLKHLKRLRDLRQHTRIPVSFETTFLVEGEPDDHTARAVDLSLTGLKIETNVALPLRTQVTLSVETLVLPATVVWSNAYFAGLRLSQPLDDETFARLKKR